jgi:hypothetical protein
MSGGWNEMAGELTNWKKKRSAFYRKGKGKPVIHRPNSSDDEPTKAITIESMIDAIDQLAERLNDLEQKEDKDDPPESLIQEVDEKQAQINDLLRVNSRQTKKLVALEKQLNESQRNMRQKVMPFKVTGEANDYLTCTKLSRAGTTNEANLSQAGGIKVAKSWANREYSNAAATARNTTVGEIIYAVEMPEGVVIETDGSNTEDVVYWLEMAGGGGAVNQLAEIVSGPVSGNYVAKLVTSINTTTDAVTLSADTITVRPLQLHASTPLEAGDVWQVIWVQGTTYYVQPPIFWGATS